ncbi:MAG: cobyrinate a,c-diamide synthase [Pseudomonadota bacterium]
MAEVAPLRPLVGFLVAAPSSGSGKTVTTLGLIAALVARGVSVRPAKVGPDYIDTAFLAAAAGRDAVNLDLWAMRGALVDALAAQKPGEVLVVEGVMGLFDGPRSGKGSSADIAKRLGLPVVLVVNAAGMSHSVAALVHGFASFDPEVQVAGAILTNVASARHAEMLSEALDGAGMACFGAIPRSEALSLESRHLGLKQAAEIAGLRERIGTIAQIVGTHCDLDALLVLRRTAESSVSPPAPLPPPGQRIAIAKDAAFTFAYSHILSGWQRAGAEVRPFSPLAGEAPRTDADCVVYPGGYPELHAGCLASQSAWRDGTKARADAGALVYGECGGYMALGERLVDGKGESHQMAGLLPVTTSFAKPARVLGYRSVRHDGSVLPHWPKILRGHEFHYASAVGEGPALFDAHDAAGHRVGPLGTVNGNVAGSFAHVIDCPESSAAPAA